MVMYKVVKGNKDEKITVGCSVLDPLADENKHSNKVRDPQGTISTRK